MHCKTASDNRALSTFFSLLLIWRMARRVAPSRQSTQTRID